jgi:zinc/manganese transport system substrate-binding protein
MQRDPWTTWAGSGGWRTWVAVVSVLTVLGAACGDGGSSSSPDGDDLPIVAVTTTIWADVVANVACDGSAVIETLIPAGADSHGFEPSLADRAVLDSASLVVANGLGLEEGLEDTIESAEADGTPVIRMGDHVDPLAGADGGEPAGSPDPHFWFDPVRVVAALPELADRLVDVGLDRAVLDGCLDAYTDALAEVDAELVELFAAIPADQREVVTSHDSLAYLADRYGLEIIGSVIPATSTLAETNPAALEELASLIEETGVEVIFADAQHSLADSEAMAERIGDVEVVVLDVGSLGEPGGDTATYVDLLRHTGRVVAGGLG